jgi:hypothetical protein
VRKSMDISGNNIGTSLLITNCMPIMRSTYQCSGILQSYYPSFTLVPLPLLPLPYPSLTCMKSLQEAVILEAISPTTPLSLI